MDVILSLCFNTWYSTENYLKVVQNTVFWPRKVDSATFGTCDWAYGQASTPHFEESHVLRMALWPILFTRTTCSRCVTTRGQKSEPVMHSQIIGPEKKLILDILWARTDKFWRSNTVLRLCPKMICEALDLETQQVGCKCFWFSQKRWINSQTKGGNNSYSSNQVGLFIQTPSPSLQPHLQCKEFIATFVHTYMHKCLVFPKHIY